MARFVVERTFTEELNLDKATAATIKQVGNDLGADWLYSFLSADKKKTYCVYEAPNEDAVRQASTKLNIPVDTVTEIGGELRAD